ncbi:SAM-dependent methyltransferase [Rhodovulum sp. DZ06]|uniref:SAM-dependent methyltransferase n=1 Tax=Rhodovulum sp. DZ06 TaxID=3425126 RepID=UPI003D33722F
MAIREGEERLGFDPAARGDASIAFLGRIRTPWSKGDCPKNIARARETGQGARVELLPECEALLTGLAPGRWVMLLYWMDRAERDIAVQRPGHVDGPRGCFAIRTPARPNPISMACVQVTGIEGTTLHIDAADCFDGTPLVDIKPWLPTVDAPPGAASGDISV